MLNKWRNWLYLLGGILLAGNCMGQELRIGDTFPYREFKQVINARSNVLDFSVFKGKLIILDFWSLSCLPCIKSFPELESLQEKFKDRIQIVLVNHESRDSTTRFFEKRKHLKMPGLPMITSDKVLNEYFPHTGVPFHVWIDGSGKVAYTTNSYYTTAENISQFLAGTRPDIPDIESSKHLESLFDRSIGPDPKYYSYIRNCINDGSVHLIGPADDAGSIATDICLSIMQLYQVAYNESLNMFYKFCRPGRTILETVDSFKYFRPDNYEKLQTWVSNHSYYYQLLVPERLAHRKFEIMRQDLDRFFGLYAKIEKRAVNCLVLERTSTMDKLKSKASVSKNTFVYVDEAGTERDSVRVINNLPFAVLSKKLQTYVEQIIKMPFFDDTNYSGNIDISFDGNALDNPTLESFNRQLKKYDLRLAEKPIVLEVLVLRDSGNQVRLK